MNIEIAEHARMSESGSSLLRLIQNNSLPILDLLVREVVQNSLDAADQTGDCVDVDFICGSFEPHELNAHFEGIDNKLNNRFGHSRCSYIAVKDCYTVGLTGPLHFDSAENGNFGNLLKLVYEISIPQQNEGSGGSWGLGKTVYFRVGIGLVIYYSRIRTKNGYETRMAASLVEDQTSPEAMLPAAPGTKLKRGIAWWGQQDGKNKTIPLVNSKEISQILHLFGIREYSGNETGTTVIIPYISEDNLLGQTIPEQQEIWWYAGMADYLKVALQRWYAPRLMNNEYKYGKWLRAKVNGRGIAKTEFLPLFQLTQKLYNRVEDDRFHYSEIQVRNVLGVNSIAGFVGYTKLSKADLQMLPPVNMPSPYTQANLHDVDKDFNQPIICYTRQPGMIVSYETSGKWVEGIPHTREDEFIVAVFVLNTGNKLKSAWQDMPVEEYVRKCEKADHTSWDDFNIANRNSPLLVARIQRGVRKTLTDTYVQTPDDQTARKKIGLGRTLAGLFLPPENFGRRASGLPPTGSGRPGNGGGASPNPKLAVLAPVVYSGDIQTLSFELFCGTKNPYAQVSLKLSSENGEISVADWENKLSKRFPAEVLSVSIDKYRSQRKKPYVSPRDLHVQEDSSVAASGGITLQLIKSKVYATWTGFVIELPGITGYTVTGKISIKLTDPRVQCVITVV